MQQCSKSMVIRIGLPSLKIQCFIKHIKYKSEMNEMCSK